MDGGRGRTSCASKRTCLGGMIMSETTSPSVLDALSSLMIDHAARTKPLLVGVTGSVAAGKSTLCRQLTERLTQNLAVEAASTDGFLLSNAVLARRDLAPRKGFPESYDADSLFAALAAVRSGPTPFPGYSHTTYDVDPNLTRLVDRPDVLILEGLAFSPFSDGRTIADMVDLLIYVDASEADLEAWFVERFMDHWRAAEHNPVSFYAQFRHMSPNEADQFSRTVWTRINLPNLRHHICLARDRAHIVLRKTREHQIEWAIETGDGLREAIDS